MKKITLKVISDSIDKLAISTGKGFAEVDRRIDGLEVTMNHRFDEIGGRLTSVERRITILEEK